MVVRGVGGGGDEDVDSGQRDDETGPMAVLMVRETRAREERWWTGRQEIFMKDRWSACGFETIGQWTMR